MSYIDALFDREHDRIHTVERRNGDETLETILETVGKTL
jgi:hypothetical protein